MFKLFMKAMDTTIAEVASHMPKNLRQYYADRLMLLKVELEFGC